jgi:hypothetical protein
VGRVLPWLQPAAGRRGGSGASASARWDSGGSASQPLPAKREACDCGGRSRDFPIPCLSLNARQLNADLPETASHHRMDVEPAAAFGRVAFLCPLTLVGWRRGALPPHVRTTCLWGRSRGDVCEARPGLPGTQKTWGFRLFVDACQFMWKLLSRQSTSFRADS